MEAGPGIETVLGWPMEPESLAAIGRFVFQFPAAPIDAYQGAGAGEAGGKRFGYPGEARRAVRLSAIRREMRTVFIISAMVICAALLDARWMALNPTAPASRSAIWVALG